MRKIPVKEYARLNGMSIYQVIRKIARGELEGVTLEENGTKVNYVVLDEARTGFLAEAQDAPDVPEREPGEEDATPADLPGELKLLREEVARLREEIRRCCMKKG
jgi:hypothetical protein